MLVAAVRVVLVLGAVLVVAGRVVLVVVVAAAVVTAVPPIEPIPAEEAVDVPVLIPPVPVIDTAALTLLVLFDFSVVGFTESALHSSFFCSAFTISFCEALVKPEAGGLSEY